MAEEVTTIEKVVPPIVPEQNEVEVDLEAEVSKLQAEKNRLIEESANYRVAYLKEKKKKENFDDEIEETEDEKIRRIAAETVADSRIAEIAREQDVIIKKALKENRELKLAVSNKTPVAAAVGAHTENSPVVSTSVTPEQLTAFKAKGWSDKDIERYKKNLKRYGG